MQNAQICILNLFKSGFISKQDLLKALKILEKNFEKYRNI